MDFIIAGVADEDGVSSQKLVLDAGFGAKSHYFHERNYGSRGPRFRFRQSTGLVYWYHSVDDEVKCRVADHIFKKTGRCPSGHVLAIHPQKYWQNAHGL